MVASSSADSRGLSPGARRRALEAARGHFLSARFWEAHEALETVWRSVSEESERRIWQGLIQAAAALLHQSRGNAHGVAALGGAALAKLAGPQHPSVEFDTLIFRAGLELALRGAGPVPTLEWREP